MNIKVLYHTKTGNTKKVAEAIACAVGVPAEEITAEKKISGLDLLFIGDGLYGGTVGKKTKAFILSLNPSEVKAAAVFSTYGGQDKVNGILKSLLQERGIAVQEDVFGCRGKAWWIINRSHPNAEELRAAGEFAKRAVEVFKGK